MISGRELGLYKLPRFFGEEDLRPEAQSVVIHAIEPGGTPAGGIKIACADLR